MAHVRKERQDLRHWNAVEGRFAVQVPGTKTDLRHIRRKISRPNYSAVRKRTDGSCFVRAGNGTIIEPILRTFGPYIYLVFKLI